MNWMKSAGMLGTVSLGAWIGIGAGGAPTPRPPPSTNPCTLNKGECYSIQGESPSAHQCAPPMIPYYVEVERSSIFLECLRGHANE